MSLVKTAIGLMSGTSMDGIDVALMRTDGLKFIENVAHFSLSYSDDFRAELKNALLDAEKIVDRNARPGNLKRVENALTLQHCEAVRILLEKNKLKAEDIDLIGFHGQTILHRPQKALTVQLGDGVRLAHKTKIDVVYDMRANDMLHGGQGAPLVPVYHRALVQKHNKELVFPVAFVNIGGISNLTYIDENDSLIAFDCGPGNVLIDQWIQQKIGASFDENGLNGLKGKVNFQVIDAYKKHAFFNRSEPGSLDWRDFSPLEWDLTLEDGAASLAFITAYGIIHSFRYLPSLPKTIIVSGGGAKNLATMKYLTELAGELGASVFTSDKLGLCSDFIEAEAWAYLAVRSFYGFPLTFPSTTGCSKPVTGGKLALVHPDKRPESYLHKFLRIRDETLEALQAENGKSWRCAKGELHMHYKEIPNWIDVEAKENIPEAFHKFWEIIAPYMHDLEDINFTVGIKSGSKNNTQAWLSLMSNEEILNAVHGNIEDYY